MNSIKSILGAVVAAALVAGCGGLDSPDLNTGQVSGRLTGDFKKGVAFAYAFGAPETKVLVGDDGSYTLKGVPVASNGNVPAGQAQVVLFDGDTRADIQIADVKPASRTQADDRDSGTLAHARSVVAAARCSGGASGSKTVYSVDGAALKDDAKGDVATLFPLPPGVFKVRAKLSGFHDKVQDVDLNPDADAQLEMELELDEGDDHRGCLTNGCTDGRECDHDGQCYGCTVDAPCAPGFKCDNRVCVANSGPLPACASCSSSTCEVSGSSSPGTCVPDGFGAGNVCSNTCATNNDCPSGFACNLTSGVCAPPAGCSAYFQAFGSVCFQASQCALADAACVGASGSTAGYCTSRCSGKSDCPDSLGYICTGGFCLKK